MRKGLLAALVGVALATVSASSVLADTTGGGGSADLGLDAIRIDGGTVVSKTGFVTLTGSIDCSQDIQAYVGADAAQVVGRFNTIRGFGDVYPVTCLAADGRASFTMSFFADQGKFAPGSVRVSAYADVGFCDDNTGECFDEFASFGPASIRLTGLRR